MKRTRIYLCVTLFCVGISGPVLAQRAAFALRESASSRQSFRGTIRDVVFAERRSNDKVELYPRVIFYKDKIVEFFNDQGRLISSMLFAEYYRSPGGNFVGLLRRQGDESPYSLGRTFTLYDSDGNVRFVDSFEGRFDDGYDFRISDKDGSVVKIDGSFAKLHFLDNVGTLRKQVAVFGKVEGEMLRGLLADFSPHGNYFVVLTEKEMADNFRNVPPSVTLTTTETRPVPVPKKKKGPFTSNPPLRKKRPEKITPVKTKPSADENLALILFDDSGEELWRKYLDVLNLKKIGIAKAAEYILVLSMDDRIKEVDYTIYLFDRNGNMVKRIDDSFNPSLWEYPGTCNIALAMTIGTARSQMPTGSWCLRQRQVT